MKLLRSNGETLTVRDVGPVVFELRRRKDSRVPLPIYASEVVADDDARAILRGLLDVGAYDGGKI